MVKEALAAALVLVLGAHGVTAEPRTYVVDPERSTATIHVGRAGLFKFAGHEHEVLAPRFTGDIQADPANLTGSSVSLTIDATSLKVSGRGEPPEDVPKVQERMVGPELLDVARFPSVTFRSTKIEGHEAGKGVYDLQITGELMLHGFTRSTVVQARVEVAGDALTATGSFVLRHTDFGLTPVSVAGVVKVKNEIAIEYKIQAAVRTASGGLSVPPPGGGQRAQKLTTGITAYLVRSSGVDPRPDAAGLHLLRDEWVFLGALAVAMLAAAGMPMWRSVLRPREPERQPEGCSMNEVTP
ncbi:MAG TPA: YceI family protein [Vicinamibacteria bacterium]|jgi:polyisoprenoid-binding protein YceI|nr:YceI family protein [Vicinamibacteria bacterium]